MRFFERKAAEGKSPNSDDEMGFDSPTSAGPSSSQPSPSTAVSVSFPVVLY